MLKSCKSYSSQRPAVGCSDWLDVFRLQRLAEKAVTMSGCRNMMANQTGGDAVAMIVLTSIKMSLPCTAPCNMPPEKNMPMLNANSQQRATSAVRAHEQPHHRK